MLVTHYPVAIASLAESLPRRDDGPSADADVQCVGALVACINAALAELQSASLPPDAPPPSRVAQLMLGAALRLIGLSRA